MRSQFYALNKNVKAMQKCLKVLNKKVITFK